MTQPTTNKPPYRVPSMAEINTIQWNGCKVASTFSGCGGSCLGYRMAGFKVVWANEFVPAAQASYNANKTDDCYLDCRDIKLVRPEEILEQTGLAKGELDLFDGSPPCFAAGVPVVTQRGVVPIESVVPGDMVLTHKRRWRRVVRCMSRVSPTVLVDGRIEATPDHRFYAKQVGRTWANGIRQYRRTLSDVSWVEAEHVGGTFGATPIDVEECQVPDAPEGFSYSTEFWYAIGRWVGDGWLRLQPGDAPGNKEDRPQQNTSPVPCILCGKPSEPNRHSALLYTNYCSRLCAARHKRKRRRRPRAEVIVCTEKSDTANLKSRLESLGTVVGVSEERTVSKLHISRKSLALWLLRWFGRGAGSKTIPGWSLGMSIEWRSAMLDGYRDADGDQPTTVSRCLAVGMGILAGTVGKTVSVSKPYLNKKNVIEGRKVNVRPQYRVSIKEDDKRYTVVEDGLRWRKIRKKSVPVSAAAVVYDFEVEEDHSFVADLFVVHNCQAFSTAGKRHKGWGHEKTYEHGAKQCNERLFDEYIRLLRGLMPKTFVAENVSGLVKGTAKGMFLEILAGLKASGYRVKCKVLDAQWLGVPQMRQRTIFVGVREDLGLDPVHPKPLPYRYSVRDALPDILSVAKMATNHQPSTQPSTAITTHGFDGSSNRIVETTTEKRKFTIAELKRICAFPDSFVLVGSYAQMWERLGNSVPPVMMFHVARTIADEIFQQRSGGFRYDVANGWMPA